MINLQQSLLKICLFLLGVLVGISRIYLLYHWTSDVLSSIILSYFIVRIIDKKLKMGKSMVESNKVENRC
ncbi:phosphatase PAP2 family protein [Fusobacterium mortiferum]|nr:phosphatase PAP2 family protein [Fusobacterium mortiferum]